MKNIEIKKITESDIAEVVDIWYEVSLQAHRFVPAEYWEKKRDEMRSKYIPMSETFKATDGARIAGFVSLVDGYLAALFVRAEYQGRGIGSMLLNHAVSFCGKLQLKVFCKNEKSVAFYKSKGFSVVSTSTDDETGEDEFVMENVV